MNKQNKASILVLIIIAIVIGIFLYYIDVAKYTKVEQLTMCKIIDSTKGQVNNYEENKMPFTIEATEEAKIIVNGVEYQKGKRLYKKGKYEIKISNGEKSERAIVNIKEIERSEENEYNIYSMLATLPTLFSSMNIVDNIEQQGYYWTERISTIDIEKLKKYCPGLEISTYINTDPKENPEQLSDKEMRQYVERILKSNPDAHFNLHIDESRFFNEFNLFAELGLTDDRYNIYLYSDGTQSYVQDYEIAQGLKYEKFVEEKANYDKFLDEARSGKYKQSIRTAGYLINSEYYNPYTYNYNYLLISTLKDNVKYILQYPEMIKFNDKRIAKEMKKANFSKIVAQEEFSRISEEGKNIFFDVINFNKEEMDQKYFNQADDANYLIITGTNPFYGIVGKNKFESLIEKVYEKYKDEYTILYKPHPSALPDEEQEKFLSDKNIKVLPGRIPMEAISYIYPNLKLGGFGSSLYMSVDEGKTLFFFERKKEDLVEPLNILYDDMFSTAEFLK